jgi:hypothetical protein
MDETIRILPLHDPVIAMMGILPDHDIGREHQNLERWHVRPY